ncbi:iron-sulfur cluster biosynthesis family protein [Enterococcus sp. S86.2]|uniref:iron-sulfur cluster biosynthesis family protein n=1 Tax=Enterococcus sp. S86.2 TaxID=3031299 RepID=UPI0026EDC378|nr:iron-sulfur cluster biosynthesis family protein [Enterococcus sp. S86.2]
MKLSIDTEVVKLIRDKMQPGDLVYLDFEDGDGPFANTGLSCRLDLSFRIIITPADYPAVGLNVYNETLITDIGPLKIKKSSERYLEENTRLVVNQTLQTLQLKGDSGILANNIPILRIDKVIAGGNDGKISGC